jgi:hypothetical protein
MIIFQPEVGERLIHTVGGDVGCREVRMDVTMGRSAAAL